jgi:hypothetical protein
VAFSLLFNKCYEHLAPQVFMSGQEFLSLQVPLLNTFKHLPWHSFFVCAVSVLTTGPFANTVALANNMATTPKLIFFISMILMLNNNYPD